MKPQLPATLCGYPIVFSDKAPKLNSGDIQVAQLEDFFVTVRVTCQECGWSEEFVWGEVKKIKGKTVQCPGCGRFMKCPEEAEFLNRKEN